jgi:CHASE2 domain-containing sensor protein
MQIQDQVKELFSQVRRKGLGYWCIAVALILIGMYLGEHIGELDIWVDMRYRLYQSLQQLAPHDIYPKRTAIVLIGDEEYWNGELARRVPIKRDYIAKLLEALDTADPQVIALDFDLHSQTLDGTLLDHPDYILRIDTL